MIKRSYASVKNPMPAVSTILAWNFLMDLGVEEDWKDCLGLDKSDTWDSS